jgi:hypothetical protein
LAAKERKEHKKILTGFGDTNCINGCEPHRLSRHTGGPYHRLYVRGRLALYIRSLDEREHLGNPVTFLALPLKVTGKNRAKMLGKFFGKAKTQNAIRISS